MIRILVVDDEADLRLLLRAMLDLDPRIHIAGEAVDGGEALVRFEALRPDVVVIDQRMPVLSGIEAATRILADHPDQAIILFTAFVDEQTTAAAREAGIASILAKDQLDQLAPEIHRLASHRR